MIQKFTVVLALHALLFGAPALAQTADCENLFSTSIFKAVSHGEALFHYRRPIPGKSIFRTYAKTVSDIEPKRQDTLLKLAVRVFAAASKDDRSPRGVESLLSVTVEGGAKIEIPVYSSPGERPDFTGALQQLAEQLAGRSPTLAEIFLVRSGGQQLWWDALYDTGHRLQSREPYETRVSENKSQSAWEALAKTDRILVSHLRSFPSPVQSIPLRVLAMDTGSVKVLKFANGDGDPLAEAVVFITERY